MPGPPKKPAGGTRVRFDPDTGGTGIGLGAPSAPSVAGSPETEGMRYGQGGFKTDWMEKSRRDQIDRGYAGEVDAWTPPPVVHPGDDTELDWLAADIAKDQAAHEKLLRETPAYWTTLNAVYDPKLQFRFKVTVEGLKFEDKPGWRPPDDFNDNADGDNGVAWYAKSVDKPGLILKVLDQDRIVKQGAKKQSMPSVESPELKPINMVLVDPTYPNVTRKIIRWIRRSGLHEAQAQQIISDAKKTRKKSFLDTIGPVTIEQLAPNGKWLEKWTLHGAFPADISFGKLDYSSNDLVEINMTWYYTSFTVEFSGFNPKTSSTLGAGPIGKEDYYDYFRGDDTVPPTPPQETQTSCAERWRLLGSAGQAVWNSQDGYAGFAKSACGLTVAAPAGDETGTDGDHAAGTADLPDTDEVPAEENIAVEAFFTGLENPGPAISQPLE